MRTKAKKTLSAKPAEVTRQWLLIDGQGLTFGRVAADVAVLLRGKHKPIFTPHVDTGDFVVVVNAAGLVLTGGKAAHTTRYHHTGWPGGLRSEAMGEWFRRDPAAALHESVKGMLPHGVLGRQMLRKLKTYNGPEHPHQAQGVVSYSLPHARANEEVR
jgi:large subunit ribosomal protein L13